MPKSMPTLSFSCPLHCLQRVLLLGMHIPPRGPNIAVPGQLLDPEDIHVGRPACEARVPKCVKVEVVELRQLASLCVLLLKA